ncbi:MAG: glycosyltransferase, partial [Bacteroidales bacterium]
MKVLHVIPAIAPCYGGPSAALPQMCRALAQQGIEPTIATTDADGRGRLAVPLEVATTYDAASTIFFHRQYSESFKYSRPLASWLARNVRSFDIVHIHAVLSHACLAAGRACRTGGVPYVVRPLGTLDPWSLGQKALKKRLLLRAAGRSMLWHAAAIQYTSREEKRLVESSLGLVRGAVIPLGVDDGLFARNAASRQSNREEAPPYVLALSRLHPVKGLEALITAFGRAVPRDVEWRLVIAGDGDGAYVDALKRLAGESGAGERVVFPGWV